MRVMTLALVLALAGCGDDTSTTTGSGGGATSSTDATGTTTSSTSQSTTGSGGSTPGAAVGEPCSEHAECEAGLCLDEVSTGYPGGYCAAACDPNDASTCDGVCALVQPFGWVCRPSCLGAGVCRPAYACAGSPDAGYSCSPFCAEDADCTTTGICDASSHLCRGPELDCNDLLDDNDDDRIDCADPSCFSAPECEPGTGQPGDPCTVHSDCASPTGHPLCLSEARTGMPGGACVEPCDSVVAGTQCTVMAAYCVQSRVLPEGALVRHCPIEPCSAANPCRTGYTCACLSNCTSLNPATCVPDCTGDGDCTVTGHTCQSLGTGQPDVCVPPDPPEDCANAVDDDDEDDDADCQDTECAAPCATLEASLCAGTATLAATQTGTTVSGPGIGGKGCVPSGSVGKVTPVLYHYQAAGTGTLSLALTSTLPQAMRVVAGCDADVTTDLGCDVDTNFDGAIAIDAAVTAGADYTIWVWPAGPGLEDTFTLTAVMP